MGTCQNLEKAKKEPVLLVTLLLVWRTVRLLQWLTLVSRVNEPVAASKTTAPTSSDTSQQVSHKPVVGTSVAEYVATNKECSGLE